MVKRLTAVIGAMAVLAPVVVVHAAGDIAGTWAFELDTPGGVRMATAVVKVDDEKVTGTFDDQPIEGVFKDDVLNLSFPYNAVQDGLAGTLSFSGKLESDTVTGTWTFTEYTGTFKATRTK